MQRHLRRSLAITSAAAAVMVTAPLAGAAPQTSASAELMSRPAFKMPFLCGQRWLGNNWNGHSPAHSIDWNHYSSSGATDDFKRRVFASAGGTVLQSYYSKTTGYGNTVVIGHGGGWQTRYAHLYSRAVHKGDHVKLGQKVGLVGASSAKYDLSPHLHYEQIHDGHVVVSHIQGVTWKDYLKRYQTSKNRC